jgi:hypothetical protein
MRTVKTTNTLIAAVLLIVLVISGVGMNAKYSRIPSEDPQSQHADDDDEVTISAGPSSSNPFGLREENTLRISFHQFSSIKIKLVAEIWLNRPVRYTSYYNTVLREGLPYLWSPTIPVAQKKLLI